jgi:hypothetical protein
MFDISSILSANSSIFSQQRFYLDELSGWTDWEYCTPAEYTDIQEYIKWGKRYQLRVMIEQSREGYIVPETNAENL